MKERLTRNIGMKIISLIIAVFLWIIINGLTDPVTTKIVKDIPVELLNEDAMESVGKIFEVLSGEKVSIKVRAKRSIAEHLEARDFRAVADVSKMTELNAVAIVVNSIGYDEAELEILETEAEDGTNMVLLALEDSDTQSFAVSVVADGTVADGYYITESLVSPNLLTITGSKTQIAKIAKIAVLVNVDGANGSFVQAGTPVAYDKNGNVIEKTKLKLSADQVQVSMTLLPTKTIALEVEASGTPFYNYACTGIEYAPNTVLIAGRQSDLNKISQLKLQCDINNARKNVEAELNVKEALNKIYGNTYILVDENEKVSVKASIDKMETKELPVLTGSIEVKNLAEGLKVEFSELTVAIQATALAEKLSEITSSSLNAYIDCKNYTRPGSYLAVVHTQYPDIVKIVTVGILISDADPDTGEALEAAEGKNAEAVAVVAESYGADAE